MKLKYDIVGQKFKNNKGYEFVVLAQSGRTKNGAALYTVQFVDTGTLMNGVTSVHIRNGEVKDPFAPSVFGVGCLGSASGYAKRNESRRLYYTWRNMIRRCYDESYDKYQYYGGSGVSVCDRWLRFDLFLEDIKKLPGFDEELFENNQIELDKDLRDPDAKTYSPETCTFLSHAENNKIALHKRWHPSELLQ